MHHVTGQINIRLSKLKKKKKTWVSSSKVCIAVFNWHVEKKKTTQPMGLLSKGKGLVQTSWSSGVHKLIADCSNWQQNDSGKLGFNFNESHDLQ